MGCGFSGLGPVAGLASLSVGLGVSSPRARNRLSNVTARGRRTDHRPQARGMCREADLC